VQQRVTFTGLIPPDLLPAYYQACDVFCLPSVNRAEAFGIVQVEAMAAGKPVVSSALGNGVDYVNQHGVTGLTPPPGDVAALASALGQLLDDASLRQKFGQQAQARVEQEFSLGHGRADADALPARLEWAASQRHRQGLMAPRCEKLEVLRALRNAILQH